MLEIGCVAQKAASAALERLWSSFIFSYLVPWKEELTVRVECKAVDVSAMTRQLLNEDKVQPSKVY
jgi:hypothetical protein